jgi:hypothetical protein
MSFDWETSARGEQYVVHPEEMEYSEAPNYYAMRPQRERAKRHVGRQPAERAEIRPQDKKEEFSTAEFKAFMTRGDILLVIFIIILLVCIFLEIKELRSELQTLREFIALLRTIKS